MSGVPVWRTRSSDARQLEIAVVPGWSGKISKTLRPSTSSRLVRVASIQEEPDLDDPEIFKRIGVSYDHRPATADYYDNPAWNQILDSWLSHNRRVERGDFLLRCNRLRQRLSRVFLVE